MKPRVVGHRRDDLHEVRFSRSEDPALGPLPLRSLRRVKEAHWTHVVLRGPIATRVISAVPARRDGSVHPWCEPEGAQGTTLCLTAEVDLSYLS